MFVQLYRLLRPKQWSKNLLLFLPLLLTKSAPTVDYIHMFYAFICFSLTASLGYIFNDWSDRLRDQFHHTKKFRPIASGKLTPNQLISIVLTLIVLVFSIQTLLPNKFGFTLFSYLSLSFLYTKFLKNLVILDILTLSSFYVIRVISGALVAEIHLSNWFVLVVGFGSLLLGSSKRFSEIKATNHSNLTRMVLEFYTEEFLRSISFLACTCTLISFSLWAFDFQAEKPPYFIQLSILPLIYFCFKYLLLTEKGETEGPEELIFRNKALLTSGVLIFMLIFLGIRL